MQDAKEAQKKGMKARRRRLVSRIYHLSTDKKNIMVEQKTRKRNKFFFHIVIEFPVA